MTLHASTAASTPIALSCLHPWWTQVVLHARRSLDGLRIAAFVVLVAVTLFTAGALALNPAVARHVYDYRHAAAATASFALLFLMRTIVVDSARAFRYGWMAALPLPARSSRRTLVLAVAMICALVFVWLSAGLAGLGVSLGVSAFVDVLGNLMLGIAVSCAALAWLGLRAWERPAAPRPRSGMRIPLFSLAWLEHVRLPHLVAWQHRECTRRWRVGGGARPVGAVLLLFPGSSSSWHLVGLIALVAVVAWHRCLLQASLDVAEKAGVLSRHWSVPSACTARALIRLPAAGSVVAYGMAFGAMLMLQPPWVAAACASLALVLASPITLARLVARFRNLDA